jgi:RNA polymerase sigma factor (sigma-70 family)
MVTDASRPGRPRAAGTRELQPFGYWTGSPASGHPATGMPPVPLGVRDDRHARRVCRADSGNTRVNLRAGTRMPQSAGLPSLLHPADPGRLTDLKAGTVRAVTAASRSRSLAAAQRILAIAGWLGMNGLDAGDDEPPRSGQNAAVASRKQRLGGRQLEALYVAHYGRLVGLAQLILGGNAAAEDIVQEAFIRVCGSRSTIRDPDRAACHLRITVMNLARSSLRRQQTALRHAPGPPTELAVPAEPVLTTVRNAGVMDALRQLPWSQQQVIMLRYYADLSVLQTAQTLRISAGTVETRGSRALASLGEALHAVGDSAAPGG